MLRRRNHAVAVLADDTSNDNEDADIDDDHNLGHDVEEQNLLNNDDSYRQCRPFWK